MIGLQLSGGQFQIVARLGTGGFAAVYRGAQRSPSREVAIKVLHENLAHQADIVARFHHEAQTLARFDHPHIIKIFFEGEDQGLHYFVANLLREDLRRRLDRTPVPALEDTLRVLRQVTDALDYMHRKGFIHRDFKPANIMFDENENAVLTDFGLARGSELSMATQPGVVMGTASYMAPEQIQGASHSVSPRSDLYALGCVLFEMVEGHPPYPGTDFFAACHSHLYDPVPPLTAPDLPPNLPALVTALLAKKPEDRPESAEEVLDEISAAELYLANLRGPGRRREGRSSSFATPLPATEPQGPGTPVTAPEAAPEPPRQAAATLTPPGGMPSTAGEPGAWSMIAPAGAAAPKPAEAPRPPAPAEPAPARPAPPARPADPAVSGAFAAVTGAGEAEAEEAAGTARPRRKGFRVPLLVGLVGLAFVIALATQLAGRRHAGQPAQAPGPGDHQAPSQAGAASRGAGPTGAAGGAATTQAGGTRNAPGGTQVPAGGATGATGPPGAGTAAVPVPPPAPPAAETHPGTAPGGPATAAHAGHPGAAGGHAKATPAPPEGGGEAPSPGRPGEIRVSASAADKPFLPVLVALDGQSTGEQTPCVLKGVSPEVHRIRISKTGYSLASAFVDDVPTEVQDGEVILNVKPGKPVRLRLVLQKD